MLNHNIENIDLLYLNNGIELVKKGFTSQAITVKLKGPKPSICFSCYEIIILICGTLLQWKYIIYQK